MDIKSFRSHYGHGVDSDSNRNEYQEYFLGGQGGRCVRLTAYHHPVLLSRNLGTLTSWNPLGTSGPVTGLIYLFTSLKYRAVKPVNGFKFESPAIQRSKKVVICGLAYLKQLSGDRRFEPNRCCEK